MKATGKYQGTFPGESAGEEGMSFEISWETTPDKGLTVSFKEAEYSSRRPDNPLFEGEATVPGVARVTAGSLRRALQEMRSGEEKKLEERVVDYVIGELESSEAEQRDRGRHSPGRRA